MEYVEKSRTVSVSQTGRMNLPADMRRALGLTGPGRVIVTQEEGGLRITTMQQSLKHIRDLARPYRPKRFASDELISDRRMEAARQDTARGSSKHG